MKPPKSRPARIALAGAFLVAAAAAFAQPMPSAVAPTVSFHEKMPPTEAGARLIQAFIAGDAPGKIAPYFEEEVHPKLTPETIDGFRSEISWASDVLGDAMALFASGSRPLPSGGNEYYREYRFAFENDQKHPVLLVQVTYGDSLTNKASGVFVKNFVADGRERKIGEGRAWQVDGRKVDVHSLALIEFEPGFLLAVKVEDTDTASIETREAALPFSAPIAREAVARGWLDSARAAMGTRPKPLLDEVGVLFMRVDPRLGYTHFRHTVTPEEYAPAAKKAEGAKAPAGKQAETKKGK